MTTQQHTDRPLDGKVVLVSGASRRLGRTYAHALARAGARVVALARTLGDDPAQMGTLREVEASARAQGLDVTARRVDLTDEDSVRGVVEDVARELGGIDGIVNNAVASSERMECRGISQQVWDEAFAVNVRAPYLLVDSALPYLRAGDGGSVVNITSLAAGPTGKGGGAHAGLLLYGLTKSALNRLTSWYAAELADDGIAVNAISPGDVSVYLRTVNDITEERSNREVVAGEQLDEDFWGAPVAWLIGARPTDLTGEVLHTYTFGESWGPDRTRELSPALSDILGRDNLRAR
ncbi:SDR family NAD(P)-dependent oxidoreductase [Trujillonella endophytica]|uniref:NAD(P)-dependent dehydrogenase, short-chain alcohol dehydrogenase family n=1 Tax=Trujillonella endophytica TaxID=673521 RepID=A0A1H8Q491_9ACTN|nr:SDR family oxidoreductase [Trujillella endophytica]SEO49072.1 NAD(P)-dependent dehydrogenase, short-chain alcohol dehydrogenase family [Trujillella endophytica]